MSVEPDNNLQKANDSGVSSSGKRSFTTNATIDSDDVDLYRFQADVGDEIVLDLDAGELGSNLDSELRLFARSGKELGSNDDLPAPGERQGLDSFIAFIPNKSDEYYVGVSSTSNSDYDPINDPANEPSRNTSEEYQLNISFAEEVSGLDADNTINEAIALELNEPGDTQTIDDAIELEQDIDLYRLQLEVGEGATFDIDASELGSTLDSRLRLFDAEGKEINASDDNPASGEELSLDPFLTFIPETAGEYYIGVSQFNNLTYDPIDGSDNSEVGNTGGEYTLEASLFDLDTIPSKPAEDLNNTLDEAIATELNEAGESAIFDDVIEPTADVDIYQVQLEIGETLKLDLDANALGSELDSRLRLFDAAGNEIAGSDDDAAPGEDFSLDSFLNFTADASGLYYVGVSSFGNAVYDPNIDTADSLEVEDTTGSYKLILEIASADEAIIPAIPEDFDIISGTDAAETLSGNANSTFIDGSNGDDVITGASNDDYFIGGGGSDILSGNDGNDTLIGGIGFDFLSGGAGADYLQGDENTNTLFGGVGADTFAIANRGNNTIVDFELGTDMIQLGDGVTFEDLAIENIVAGGATISLGNSVTSVTGVSSDDLSAANFLTR